MDNKIRKYDQLLYESGPVKFSDYMNNKYDIIHNRLFIIARNKLLLEKIFIDDLNVIISKLNKKYDICLHLKDNVSNINEQIDYVKYSIKRLKIEYTVQADIFNCFKDAIKALDIDCYIKSNKIIDIKNDEYWKPSKMIICKTTYPFKRTIYDLTEYWPKCINNFMKDISSLKITNENINDSEVTYLDYISGKAKMESRSTGIDYVVGFDYLNEDTKISDEYSLNDTFTIKAKNIIN